MPATKAHSPEVSVVVPLYNGSAFIEETLQSLLSQSLDEIEIIVIDDASPDRGKGLQVCRSLADSRVRILRNEVNLGVCGARNRGLAEARGQFIAMSDQDDISEPDRLARSVARLKENTSLGAIATAAYMLENGRRRRYYRGGIPWWILGWRLLLWFSIVHSSICYRRETLLKHGLQYDDRYRYADDFVMLGRVAAVSKVEVLSDYLVTYREHEAASSWSHAKAMNDSGVRWFRDQLQTRFEMEVSIDVARDCWGMFGSGIAPASEAALLACGKVFWDIFDHYCRWARLGQSQRMRLAQVASRRWWRGVTAFCRKNRRSDSMRLFKAVGPAEANAELKLGERITAQAGIRLRRYFRKRA
ncbi:MAG TPA: glycosyltransferase family 2 protein [Gammaproteobacteria bacterium]|nr:glycosyltransferase family 2 protein [Gammaproteobacteria bacterium]